MVASHPVSSLAIASYNPTGLVELKFCQSHRYGVTSERGPDGISALSFRKSRIQLRSAIEGSSGISDTGA